MSAARAAASLAAAVATDAAVGCARSSDRTAGIASERANGWEGQEPKERGGDADASRCWCSSGVTSGWLAAGRCEWDFFGPSARRLVERRVIDRRSST